MRLAAAIAVTFGALLMLVSVTSVGTNQLIREARWVDHTKDVLADLEGVQASITEGETGQRGFLITGDEGFLEPYHRASAALPERLRRIEAMTTDDSARSAKARRLRELVMERLAQLDLAVRLTEAGRGEEARAYVRAGTGRATMEQVRALILSMRSEERELLRVRNERSGSTARSLITTLAIGGALLFTFLILIWWLIRADLARRNRAEATIRERETRIRRLIDANLIGVLFSNGGDVTDANEAFLSIVGLDRRTFEPGRHRLFGFTAPEFRELDENCERELLETGTCRPYQKELVRPDGTRVPVLFGATSIDMGGSAPVRASFVVDLSELKRVEAERNRLYEEARDAMKARDAFLSGRGARDPDPAVGAQPHRLPAGAAPARAREREGDRPRGPVREAGRAARAPRRRAARRSRIDGAAPPEPGGDGPRPARARRRRAARRKRAARRIRARPARAGPGHGILGPAAPRPGPVEPPDERVQVRPGAASVVVEVCTRGGDALFASRIRASASTTRTSGGSSRGFSARRRRGPIRGWASACGSRARSWRRTTGRSRWRAVRARARRSACVCRGDWEGKVKVLVVEDDEAIGEALVSLLEDAGHEAVCAPDGRVALEEMRTGGEPCVILLDLAMPGMNGLQFREAQRKRRAALRGHPRHPLHGGRPRRREGPRDRGRGLAAQAAATPVAPRDRRAPLPARPRSFLTVAGRRPGGRGAAGSDGAPALDDANQDDDDRDHEEDVDEPSERVESPCRGATEREG